MAKKVFYDDDARKRVLGGAEILYNAVKTTMGPKGRNVVISKSYGNPTVTHDGVTVAKGVEIDDVDDETLGTVTPRSEEHTSELQSHSDLVCRLLLEKKKKRS